jgi:hypothetical protein
LWSTNRQSLRPGMSTAINVEPLIKDVSVTDETITAHLVDGRTISVPLAWSWRLSEATPAQRANWHLIGDGHGIHWPDVDEDLSAEGMLHGVPARRPRKTTAPATGAGPFDRGSGSRTAAEVRDQPEASEVGCRSLPRDQ